METVVIEKVVLENGQAAIEVRTGVLPTPLPLKEKQKLNLSGNLDSVELFLSSRKEFFETDPTLAKRSHIVIDTEDSSLQLVMDEADFYATTVKGKLGYNPHLAAFGINKETAKYTVQQLIDKFKMLRYFFYSIEENIKIINELRKFSASITTNLDQHNDGRGNTRNLNERLLNTDFNFSFKLNIEIYKNGEKALFEVDICPDATDSTVKFLLSSPELFELEEKHRQVELDKALITASELGITIISK